MPARSCKSDGSPRSLRGSGPGGTAGGSLALLAAIGRPSAAVSKVGNASLDSAAAVPDDAGAEARSAFAGLAGRLPAFLALMGRISDASAAAAALARRRTCSVLLLCDGMRGACDTLLNKK